MKNAPKQQNAGYMEAVRLANRLPRMLLDYNAEIAKSSHNRIALRDLKKVCRLPGKMLDHNAEIAQPQHDRTATRDLKQVCYHLAHALSLLGDTTTQEQYRIEKTQQPPRKR